MGQLTISGTILGGPAQVGGAGFPGALFTTVLGTAPSPKPFSVATGIVSRRVSQASPGFAALQGVGPTDTVTAGDFLYLRSDSGVVLRVSNRDPLNPAGPALTTLIPVQGLAILEFPPSSPLVLLEVQGSAQLEYFVSGPQ